MVMKFRILRGNHAEGTYPVGHPWAGRSITYDIGEIVDSTSNLAKFNSSGPLGPKFQRIFDPNVPATNKIKQASDIAKRMEAEANYDDGNGPHGPVIAPQLPDDGLNEMPLPKLKKLAKEEGVALPTNTSLSEEEVRTELIEAIRNVYA